MANSADPDQLASDRRTQSALYNPPVTTGFETPVFLPFILLNFLWISLKTEYFLWTKIPTYLTTYLGRYAIYPKYWNT